MSKLEGVEVVVVSYCDVCGYKSDECDCCPFCLGTGDLWDSELKTWVNCDKCEGSDEIADRLAK